MQSNNETTWLFSLKQNAVQVFSIGLLIICAALLTTHTISLQNSCTPLLEGTDISARNCPVKFADSSSKTPEPASEGNEKGHKPFLSIVRPPHGKDEATPPATEPPATESPVTRPPINKDLIGLTAGSVAAVGLAVAEAPVLVIAGVGFGVWLAARSLLSLSK